MLKVGVTGGIGSGKSMVCKVFRLLGVPVFVADDVAKELINTNPEIRRQLIDWFGEDVYLPNGAIHRKKLASIIFNDNLALEKVNRIVHPAVRNAFIQWVNKQNTAYVIQEAAIIFESKQEQYYDLIVTVTAPLEERIQRVITRDNTTRENVLSRINMQIPDEFKCEHSDFVIYADDEHMVIWQVLETDKKIKEIWQNLANG
jgi:dephospho-CoA kinase